MSTPPNPQSPRNAPFSLATVIYGIIFLAAIAVLTVTLSSQLAGQDDILTLTITDEAGEPVEDALVAYGDEIYRSSDSGKVHLSVPDSPETITVDREGYARVVGEFTPDHSREQTVKLLTVSRASEGSSGNQAEVASPPVTGESATTTGTGRAATPATGQPTIATTPQATPTQATAGEIAGTVRNIDGEPVTQGWVTDGSTFAFTDADGHFVFAPGTVQPGATLTVFSAGYHEEKLPVPADGQPVQVTLEHQMIKGLYFNPGLSYNPEDIDRFIEMANTTEVNAVVIDIKEELVFYDTSVQLFHDAGVVNPILDLPSLLNKFQDNGIYTIARLVVFKDSAVAEHFPELAVIDNQTGDLWRDMNGVAWVNPMDHTLWDANIALAHEAATLGFDEIQYDYIRFPTDGDLSRVSYGLENTQENREAAIEKFLQRSYERLIPTGAKLSADIFGYTVMVQNDLGIGQNLDQLAPHVDYLSPMIYPSHWPEGSMELPGHPNDFPYETVEISMWLAIEQLNGNRLKLRPWLQDFNMPGMREYGVPEVRAQIEAVNDLGLSGWLIWDPNNWYHEGAFLPETGDGSIATPATPAIATPAASVRTTRNSRRR